MGQVFLAPVTVEDGRYTGKWSGHNLKWEKDGTDIQCQTRIGVRGINVPVVFSIVNGSVAEDTIEVSDVRVIDKPKKVVQLFGRTAIPPIEEAADVQTESKEENGK